MTVSEMLLIAVLPSFRNDFTSLSADKFFKAKVSFVTLDETTGKEKKTSELYLVQSDTLESAESDVKSFLNDGNTTISSISETVILDVFQQD